MSPTIEVIPHWENEVESKGSKAALLDRLAFHGGLTLEQAAQMTGLAQSTVKKDLNELAHEGLATAGHLGDDLHYRHQQRPS
jgi:Fic family protein